MLGKQRKGRKRKETRETLNFVIIYKRKVYTFPEAVFVYNRKRPGRLQVRPLLRCPLSRFLMPATIRNNIDLILSYTIKLLIDTVNSIGATIGVEEERMHVCHV